ncbi:MAG: hypothetical protein ABW250_09245 [Pyrinomonadaceae bacterium]
MPEPTRDSLELALTFLEQDGDPLANYLGLIVGRVMRLNYDGLIDIFDERRTTVRGK